MRSIQYVFRRGAFALGLMAIGIGSGIGMPPAVATVDTPQCATRMHILVATAAGPAARESVYITRVSVRRPDAAS